MSEAVHGFGWNRPESRKELQFTVVFEEGYYSPENIYCADLLI